MKVYVKIQIGYCEALFSFVNIECAAAFMREAYLHKEKIEDDIKITMEIKEE